MQLNFVLGTAAELIKVYPLISLALSQGSQVRVIATGQSRENFLMQYRDLRLPEDKLRSLRVSSGDLKQARSALKWFFKAVTSSKPNFLSLTLNDGRSRSFVIVHGDTLSTLVGASLAKRAKLPLVHVEAGLRSASLFNPFPEEITRRLVSRLATYHMAPDLKAAENLQRAQISGVVLSTQGNTLMDAIAMTEPLATTGNRAPFGLVNVHRFENLNSPERWKLIKEAVLLAARKQKMIFVAHPQTLHKLEREPETRAEFAKHGIEVRERMPFTEFVGLLKASLFLISDGGSNQEECSYLGKPCLLLRMETERSEGLGENCVLSKFESEKIEAFLANPEAFARPPAHLKTSPSRLILAALETNV